MIRSGWPERIDDALRFQMRLTSRAISAAEAPGPRRFAAIDHRLSPLATTCTPFAPGVGSGVAATAESAARAGAIAGSDRSAVPGAGPGGRVAAGAGSNRGAATGSSGLGSGLGFAGWLLFGASG